jgi:antitoxin (DNA-binding transcriptional repressor) of toxin-antitoxin stability system
MQATLTELRRSPKVTNQIRAGRSIELTDHGKVVAEIQPSFKGLSGREFAALWRKRKPLDPETAREVMANIRVMEAAE